MRATGRLWRSRETVLFFHHVCFHDRKTKDSEIYGRVYWHTVWLRFNRFAVRPTAIALLEVRGIENGLRHIGIHLRSGIELFVLAPLKSTLQQRKPEVGDEQA